MSSIVKEATIEQLNNSRPEIEFTECRRWEAGRVVDVHLHKDIFQIDYFPEGKGVYAINGREFTIDAKHFYMIFPMQSHSIDGSKAAPLYGLSVKFRLKKWKKNNGQLLSSVIGVDNSVRFRAEAVFRSIISESLLKKEGSTQTISQKLMELILLLLKSSESRGRENQNHLVEAAMRFMQEYFPKNISLADIAKAAGVSPEYLCRVFKKETKKTLFATLRIIRCEQVKEELLFGKGKIYEIAGLAGFKNAQYMDRVFKAVAGKTPLAYRRENILEEK